MDDTAVGAVIFYLVASGMVLLMHSQVLGVALILNGAIALGVGMAARSMGKRETATVILGLLLGPIGALAGLIATPVKI